jgi:hypothetical protein
MALSFRTKGHIMNSGLSRRMAMVVGGTALVAIGTLTACSPTTEKEAPSTTSATTSSSASPSPTEKALTPGGNNSFSPSVNPVPPGAVCTKIENGVCVR